MSSGYRIPPMSPAHKASVKALKAWEAVWEFQGSPKRLDALRTKAAECSVEAAQLLCQERGEPFTVHCANHYVQVFRDKALAMIQHMEKKE